MTDRAIIRAGLQAIGEPVGEARIDLLITAYLESLGAEVAASSGYRVLPGVYDVVLQLRERPQCAVGLGTGNVRRGAELKLERADLNQYFDFGGFGCDHEDRAELLRIGAERGAARLGRPRSACRVVVIGDTVRDVMAALAIGAECIGVGTSGTALAELQRAGATAVCADLTTAGELLRATRSI
jgi:phosphoglycolate phosphatase-like HAD superfamily hydrolase